MVTTKDPNKSAPRNPRRYTRITIDLTGNRFGTLIAQRKDGRNNSGNARWLCFCDCGNSKSILQYRLITGKTKTCGDRSVHYGHSKTKKQALCSVSKKKRLELIGIMARLKKREKEFTTQLPPVTPTFTYAWNDTRITGQDRRSK